MLSDDTLRLRALEPEDLEWLYEIENDTAIWSHGISNVPYSRYALKNYLSQNTNDIYTDGQLRLVIQSISDNLPMGCVDLFNYDVRHSRAEVGVLVLPSYRKKGVARRALRLLLDYCSSYLYLHQTYAIVSAMNEPAKHLFLRSGFEQSAVLRDWLHDEKDRYSDALILSCVM